MVDHMIASTLSEVSFLNLEPHHAHPKAHVNGPDACAFARTDVVEPQ
jgi:hypothetical protein